LKKFNFNLRTETPRLKIYRGTNDIAASNHFLGEFQIGNYPKAKTSLDGTIFFMLSEKKKLFMEAHLENNSSLELKRVDTTAK
jgi:hypothetical protein